MTIGNRPEAFAPNPLNGEQPTPDGQSVGAGQRGFRDVQLDLGSILLCGLLLGFAAAHIQLWIHQPGLFSAPGSVLRPGALVGLGAVLLETLQGSLLLFRRRETPVHRSLSVWAATAAGSWGFMLARPIGSGYFDPNFVLFRAQAFLGAYALWQVLQLVGTAAAVASLTSLGRSFGLLAGNRGIRTGGPYLVVRHPAYASYFVVQLAYVLENLSVWNAAVFCAVVAAQLIRIRQEEAVLLRDPAYRRYCRAVKYRLLPGIY
jgi:hypothetical protein